MAQLNFNARQFEPNAGFETLPVDWYKLMAEESSIEPTKDGSGAYLKMRFTVLEALATGTKLANRKIFKMFNLRNNNPKAVEIALGQLSALAHAVGVLDVADSAMLHNIPFWARVKVRKAEDGSQYDDQNDITTFRHISDPPAAAVAAVAGSPPGGYAPPQGQPPQGQPPQGQWAPPQQAAPQQWAPPQGNTAAPQQPWQAPAAGAPPSGGAPPAGNPAGAPPAAWSPPAGGQPWQAQPPQQNAQQPATPPQQQQPPHAAQTAVPPWQLPAK